MKSDSTFKNIPIRIEPNLDYLHRKKGLATRLETFFYQHKNKLMYVHAIMFFLFLILIVLPLFLAEPPEDASTFHHFTLFSQFVLWGVWFPLVFASVIFSGRSWCGVLCPMGAASEWINKIGLKKPIPRWLKWEGTPILSFLTITILGQTLDVRDQASAILEIFGGTLLLALLIGWLYGKNKRAWCRHACPIGLLLGVFSRLGMVQFAPKHPRPGGDQYTEKGICPTMIAISQKQESRHCIQCFRCVKPSSPGGLFLRFRKLGEEIIKIKSHHPNLAEVLFIFLGTGLSAGGFLWLILPEYQILRQSIGAWLIDHGMYWIGNSGPSWLMSVHPELRQSYNWLDFLMIVGFMLGCMFLVTIVLSLCTLISSYFIYLKNSQVSLKKTFIELGYQFTPVAMLSIIISLSDKLFSELHLLGVAPSILSSVKGTLLVASMVWSVYLGNQLLKENGMVGKSKFLLLIPNFTGTAFIGLIWWPAIFGIHLSLLEQYRQHLVIFT